MKTHCPSHVKHTDNGCHSVRSTHLAHVFRPLNKRTTFQIPKKYTPTTFLLHRQHIQTHWFTLYKFFRLFVCLQMMMLLLPVCKIIDLLYCMGSCWEQGIVFTRVRVYKIIHFTKLGGNITLEGISRWITFGTDLGINTCRQHLIPVHWSKENNTSVRSSVMQCSPQCIFHRAQRWLYEDTFCFERSCLNVWMSR